MLTATTATTKDSDDQRASRPQSCRWVSQDQKKRNTPMTKLDQDVQKTEIKKKSRKIKSKGLK
jgi:hypothetical protein